MDHPPAPVLHHRQAGALAIEQAGAVEQADGADRCGQQREQVLVFTLAIRRALEQGGQHPAQHQHQPQQDADPLEDLPQAAQVHVLVALVAQPEVPLGRQLLRNGQVVAGEGADAHRHQRPEKHVHAQLLKLRVFAAVDDGGEEQTDGQEARGDPEQRGLDVPGARERVREPLRHVDAVEMLPLHRVVGGEAPQEHLEDEQGHDQEQVLAECALRGREREAGQRVARGGLRQGLFVIAQEGPAPHQEADAREQDHDAGDRPHDVLATGLVADQRLVRPVVGVGDVRAGALRRGGPGGPEEEMRHGLAPLGAGQCVLLHGEALAALAQGGRIGEELIVVSRRLRDGLRAAVADLQRAVRVRAVASVLGLELGAQRALFAHAKLFKGLAVALLGGQVEPGAQLAVQPVGCPVGGLVGPVAPDGAQLHATDRLPSGLPVEDVVLREQLLPAGGADLVGDRRCRAVDLGAEVAQQREHHDAHAYQRVPVLLVRTHVASFLLMDG